MPVTTATFDNATVVANPNGYPVRNLAESHDGSTAGHNCCTAACNDVGIQNPRICHHPANFDPVGLVIDYTFNSPLAVASKLRLYNNGGFDLNDADGFGQFDYEIFNDLNVSVATGTLVAGNGSTPFEDDFGVVQNISRVQIRNMTHLVGGADTNGTWWRELQLLIPDLDCTAAFGITATSAIMSATGIDVSAGNFYQFEWSTFPGGPYSSKSPMIPTSGSDPEAIAWATGDTLQPNTTYYYRVCLYDGDAFANPPDPEAQEYNVFPICSEECSFTTADGTWYCGGIYDPSNCVFVDTGNDDYFYCIQF